MAEEVRRVVLVGRAGSGRSTLATMLVSGELKERPSALVQTTKICKTYVGRGWTVVDTVGFGEPLNGTVSDAAAKILVIDFLKDVKGRYSHIIFVHEKGKFDRIATMVWETFRQIFTGGEKNFVVLLTKVDDPTWLDENRAAAEKAFPGCKQFLCVNFPGIGANNPDIEELNARTRKEELERLETQMKEMFKASPRVEPDIYWMGDAKIEQKAVRILQRISSGKLKMKKEIQAQPIYEYAAAIQSSINDSNTLKEKLEKISRVQNKMKSLWDKVKVHRHQCEYLIQRSCDASTWIRALYNGNKFSGTEYSAPLIMSLLDNLVSSMKAGRELLQICGDHTEQEVALSLSSPAPYRDSFSRFALVLRDLDWSLDVLLCLLHNPQAGFASRERQVWLSEFSWSEERCRLVWVVDGENKAASDADLVSSCLQADKDRQACDRKELVSYLDSVLEAQTSRSGSPLLLSCLSFQNGRLKSEDIRYGSFLRNRLRRDPSFRDPTGVPDCFWIPEKLDHVEVGFVGGGSFKSVHKCKWLGKEVAIATIHGGGEPSKTILKAEAGLLARAQHPNVISFFGYTYDEEKQQGFLVTELMETNLRTLINNKLRSQHHNSGAPFTLPVSIDILLQIVEAMIHVHECGVIHRDLKAQNCLVRCKSKGDGYVVKLIDFGESKLRTPEMGSNFKTRDRGTRSHMAPEVQGDAIHEYTWSADVYSFSITCYEILTGAEEPFGKLAGRALTAMVCAGHRPTIPDDFPCPPGLVELMTKCWAQNSKDRPTFKEVRQILWNFKLYHTIWGTQ